MRRGLKRHLLWIVFFSLLQADQVSFSPLYREAEVKSYSSQEWYTGGGRSLSLPIFIFQIMNDFEGTEYIPSGRGMLEFLLGKDNWKMGKHGNSVVMLMITGGYF